MTEYWQEDEDREHTPKVPEDIVDMVYRIRCRAVPMDHAYLLSEAIQQAMPWFGEEPSAGLHIIHGADSGNGWYRPQGASDLVYLTRRTRLELRIPAHRIDDARELTGKVLDIAGHPMEIGDAETRPLSDITTLYARYVLDQQEQDEQRFLSRVAEQLKRMSIRAKRMLPGRANLLSHPDGPLYTRSLMLADLSFEDAVRLQERGVGEGRKMGCGLFLPHKSIHRQASPD
jgi:CRISPR-associated protein Cas6